MSPANWGEVRGIEGSVDMTATVCVREGSSHSSVCGRLVCVSVCVCVFACLPGGKWLDTPSGEPVMAVFPLLSICSVAGDRRLVDDLVSQVHWDSSPTAQLLPDFCHYNSSGDLCVWGQCENWKSKGKPLTSYSNYISSIAHWFYPCIEMDLWTNTGRVNCTVHYLKQTLLTCLEPIQMTSAI